MRVKPFRARSRPFLLWAVSAGWAVAMATQAELTRLSERLWHDKGSLSGALVETGQGRAIVFYGWPKKAPDRLVEAVLLGHTRRGAVEFARKTGQSNPEARVYVPDEGADHLTDPKPYWEAFWKQRFHDYEQQTTKRVVDPMAVDHRVVEGETISFGEVEIEVLKTPGYTRDSVSYLTVIDGRRVAFTGDLILEGAKIFDLYSFQDAIPEAKVRGYHGYAGRLADLISSLELVRDWQPDVLVPGRGGVITEPLQAIETLIQKVRALYRNYLSTTALYWYFKESHAKACAERVLGSGASYEVMAYSHHEPAPEWIINTGTTRFIISDSGRAFMLDCGSEHVLAFADKLIEQGVVSAIEGIFVTHYHDDHTNFVQAASERFGCPVYALDLYRDILERPGAYRMPAMTDKPIHSVRSMQDGERMKWHEYEFRFDFFPGQTFYHGALLASRPGEPAVYFIGDAFTPSGLDDYCLLNRNLLGADNGYRRCLRLLDELSPNTLMMNEHVVDAFRFSQSRIEVLRTRLNERRRLIAELTPWDNPDYAVDEQWLRFDPYGVEALADSKLRVEVVYTRHGVPENSITVKPHVPEGWKVYPREGEFLPSEQGESRLNFEIVVPRKVESGIYVVTLDAQSKGFELRHWSEMLVRIDALGGD